MGRRYIWFNPPIPIEVLETRVLVKEPTVPATHVAVAYHPAFSYTDRAKILEAVHETAFINPVRKTPMFWGNNLVVALGGGEVLRGRLHKVRRGPGAHGIHALNSSLKGSSLKKIHG